MRFNSIIKVVDCHAEGESGQVIVGGVGDIPGDTVFDKRLYLQEHRDELRKMILFEPRGAVYHNANILVPSNHPDAQMGYIILESTEYPAMSGSNTICVATVLLETGILPMTEPTTELILESPAGLITVTCDCRTARSNGCASSIGRLSATTSMPKIEVPDLGRLAVDVAYGGMTYVLVDAASARLRPDPGGGPAALRAGSGDQARGRRAARGVAPGESRHPRHHPGRVHRPAAPRRRPAQGPERGGRLARPAGPFALRHGTSARWHSCTPGVCSRSASRSCTSRSSAPRSTA